MDDFTLQEFVVEDESIRADVFLAQKLQHTRSHVKNLIDASKVLVDGVAITKAGAMLRQGNVVGVQIFMPQQCAILPEDIAIKIVYEDDDLAVIDKPQDMSVHPSASIVSGTLVNVLLFRLNSLSGINGELRPGIVHRLDKHTSGLMLVAKNDRSHASLAQQIASKQARRSYRALCEGVIKQDSGSLTTQIGRDSKDRKKMAVLPIGGRVATTDFLVEKRFDEHTLALFTLKTGRTHQIRVHARYLGHPIVGDSTYGYAKQRFKLKGQLLHSSILQFTHPSTGQLMSFESQLPDYFEKVIKAISRGLY